MSGALFKESLRANWLIALLFVLIMMVYVTTAVSMFDPMTADALTAMLDMLPEGLIQAMGFADLSNELTQYLAGYLYGFIMIVFPMIYCILLGNRLIAKHVDTGSMAYILTTPTTRAQVAITQAVYMIISLLVVLAVPVAVTIIAGAAMFPGQLRVGAFLSLNVVTYLTMASVGGITFLGSSMFSESRYSLAFGAGISVVFFMLRMISQASDTFEWMKYGTVFSFIDATRIFEDSSYVLLVAAVLAGGSAMLYAAGVIIFTKRSLAI